MLGSVLTDAIVVIVVLGGMIFIHELGHFMAAKAFGVRVLVFSLGFGKRLLHYTWRGTDYRISALPLGGYVKMAGDDPTEVRQGEQGEFLSQPRWHRFIIVIMGPAMNALLAVALLAGLYKFHYQKPAYEEQPARVGDVDANSPAARAGLLPGDRILRLGNLRNPKWEDVEIKVLTTVGEGLPVQLDRNGEVIQTTLTPRAEGPNQVGVVGWYPYVPGVVDKVEPGFPAAKAGLQAGDAIVKLDGKEVLFWPQFSAALQAGQGKPLSLTIRRAGKDFTVTLKPTLSDAMGEKRWLIGVDFRREVLVKKLPLLSAVSASVQENVRYALVTFDVLGKILTRRMSTRSLSGPIGIAQLSGEAYRAGFPELLMLVAFISLQLGIFNVLPIPVLDGGVILLLLIETVMRRDLSLEVKERFAQVGIVFLLLLAVFVMYNDIIKTFRPY
ncbi:MAG: RIP metalloprotease RseP [Acidobacteriia bacterium]|nr:RIP metalloprotease RseP [Terriglobia bacterium]